MSVAAGKIAEVLALSVNDRAFLARQLIASLDPELDSNAEVEWAEVIDRRSLEIEQGKVTCLPIEDSVRQLRAQLHASRQPS